MSQTPVLKKPSSKPVIIVSTALLVCAVTFELSLGTAAERWMFVPFYGVLAGTPLLFVLSTAAVVGKRRSSFFGLSISGIVFLWVGFSIAFGNNRIIARVTARDGTEMCLVQRYDGPTEYNISFYERKPGEKNWGWFYYEHEDARWWAGKLTLSADGNEAVIWRTLFPVARFDIANESFQLERDGRRSSPAQERMPDGWKPEDELRRNP